MGVWGGTAECTTVSSHSFVTLKQKHFSVQKAIWKSRSCISTRGELHSVCTYTNSLLTHLVKWVITFVTLDSNLSQVATTSCYNVLRGKKPAAMQTERIRAFGNLKCQLSNFQCSIWLRCCGVTVQQTMSDGIYSSLLGNCNELPCAQAGKGRNERWVESEERVERVSKKEGERGKH